MKLIFVPGFLGSTTNAGPIKRVFKEDNVISFKYNTFLKESISKLAKKLQKFINSQNLKPNEKVNIIAVSAGGIIANYYIRFLDDKKVNKLVTVYSPFKGSFWANIAPTNFQGIKDIKVNSPLLEKMNKKSTKIPQLNFYSHVDVVAPFGNEKGPNPKHSFMPFHSLIHHWCPLLFKTKKFLNS